MARFASVSNEEIKMLVESKDSSNTKKQTEVSFNIFLSYCNEKSIAFDPKTISKESLDEVLRKFYVEIRKNDGLHICTKISFVAVRFGI